MELMKLSDGMLSTAVLATTGVAIDDLVSGARILADIRYAEALSTVVLKPNKQKKFDMQLATAGKELAAAISAIAGGVSDVAITHFREAGFMPVMP